MINKKNLWFLTLFSLILVLSVYYITMPSELLLSNNSNYLKNDKKKTEKVSTEVTESEVLTAMRVNSDESLDKELDTLKTILNDSKSTTEDKNKAYEKIKSLNEIKVKEKDLENKIEEVYKLKSFIKIENNNVKVTISSDKHDIELANKIMRTINETLNNDMTVTVEFKK